MTFMRKVTARFYTKFVMVLYHVGDDQLKFGIAKAYLHIIPKIVTRGE